MVPPLPTADTLERIAAAPALCVTGAQLFGLSLADVSAAVMIVYGLMLIAYHLRTKWFGGGAESDG